MLSAVIPTRRPDRAVGVERRHPVERELRDATIHLLGDLESELGRPPGLDRVDDRASGVVEPVAVGFLIGRNPRFSAVDLLGQNQDSDVQ
jgi:hypothetical protein